jgi:glucokinase
VQRFPGFQPDGWAFPARRRKGIHASEFIGVDIGGTKTVVVLSPAPPEILSRTEFAILPEQGPEQAIRQIKAALHVMLAAQGAMASALNGIGISCGGPLDRHTGVIQAPPNPSTWIDVPIVDVLGAEFSCPVPVSLFICGCLTGGYHAAASSMQHAFHRSIMRGLEADAGSAQCLHYFH